jgi:hypothetical protein
VGDVRYCSGCGAAAHAEGTYCVECGRSLEDLRGEPVQTSPRPVAPAAAWAGGARVTSPGIQIGSLAPRPAELWTVIALFGFAGLYFLWIALKALPATSRLFDLPGGKSLAFVLLILLFVIAAMGASLLAVASMLYKGDRVGRGLAYVIVAAVTSSVLFSNVQTTGETLAMIASLLAAAVLAFSPGVQNVFTGPNAPDRDQPTSIVVARVALGVWIALLGLTGVLYLFLADIKGVYVLLGLLFLGIAAGARVLYSRLLSPDPSARLIATLGALFVIVLLFLGEANSGFVMIVGLTAAIPVCLWLPTDARAYYGEAPLFVVGPST